MDLDIGTIIYIIITIVAIVAGAFGKKKKPGSAPSGTSDKPTNFFDKLEGQLGSLIQEAGGNAEDIVKEEQEEYESINLSDPEEVTEPLIVQEEASFFKESVSSFKDFEGFIDPNYSDDMDLISTDAIKASEEGEMIQLHEDEGHPDYYEITNDFDLETAVIYSTIINRKEF